MKKRTIVSGMAGIFVLIGIIALTRSTDAIFVAASIVFFAICIAYAEWCERL